MCLVGQCKIGYVALQGLTGVQRSCHVRQCKIGYVVLEGLTGV